MRAYARGTRFARTRSGSSEHRGQSSAAARIRCGRHARRLAQESRATRCARREPRRSRDRQSRARGAGAGRRRAQEIKSGRRRRRHERAAARHARAKARGRSGCRRKPTRRESRGESRVRPSAAASAPTAPCGGSPSQALPRRAKPRARRHRDQMGPAVRKLVEEHDLDPRSVAGTGREGRDHEGRRPRLHRRHATQSPLGAGPPQPKPTPAPASGAARRDDAATRANRRAADAGAELDRDADDVQRSQHDRGHGAAQGATRNSFEKKHGIKLGFMSFFVKACIEALRQFPLLNASVDGNDIVYHELFDIGVAVSTDRGLSCRCCATPRA